MLVCFACEYCVVSIENFKQGMTLKLVCCIHHRNDADRTYLRCCTVRAWTRLRCLEGVREWWWLCSVRLGAHWQLKSCLSWQLFFFQYRMDFTETACVCALLLRIKKDRRKKRHWVHPVVSKRLLNGLFYKFYEDLRNWRGKFFNCTSEWV